MSSTDWAPSPQAGTAKYTPSPETLEENARNEEAARKKRIRHWTPDDRAAHRLFERSRREAFKDRLTNLAAEIPALRGTDPKRLSKHVVLDESLALHRRQRERLRQVNKERESLLEEVNRWRLGAGLEIRQPSLQVAQTESPGPSEEETQTLPVPQDIPWDMPMAMPNEQNIPNGIDLDGLDVGPLSDFIFDAAQPFDPTFDSQEQMIFLPDHTHNEALQHVD